MGSIVFGFPRPLRSAVVPGGPAGTHRVVTGLKAGDTLVNVRHLSEDLVTNADITGESSISDAGEITTTTTDTTGNHILVVWQSDV